MAVKYSNALSLSRKDLVLLEITPNGNAICLHHDGKNVLMSRDHYNILLNGGVLVGRFAITDTSRYPRAFILEVTADNDAQKDRDRIINTLSEMFDLDKETIGKLHDIAVDIRNKQSEKHCNDKAE
jgi:hypothetical protein